MKAIEHLKKQELKLWDALQNAILTFGAHHESTIRAQVRWATTKENLQTIEAMIEEENNSEIILQAERDAREQMDAMINAFGRQDDGTKRAIHQWYVIDELIDKLKIERK